MVKSCSAFGCTNRDTKEKSIKFYRIPVEPTKRRLWLNAINRKNFNPSPNATICSEHFVGGMFSVYLKLLYGVANNYYVDISILAQLYMYVATYSYL